MMSKKPRSYSWGDGCQALQLVNTPSLSVIRETLPSGASESMHKHKRSQQYFYILKGKATFTVNGHSTEIEARQGIHVRAGQVHTVTNSGDDELEMMVISEPHSHSDRIEVKG